MRRKRLLSLLLVLLLTLSVLAGCSPADSPDGEVDQPDANQVEDQDDGDDEDDGEEVVAEDVLLAAAEDLMKNLPDDNFMIAGEDALEQFDENPEAIFWIDMRAAEDYEEGHIDGAVNIPYAELGKNLDRIPANKQIILQCYSGQTSAQAVAMFRLAGFNALSYMSGLNVEDVDLVTEATDLPDANEPDLDAEEQVLWDAAVNYFSADTNHIVQAEDLNDLVEENPDAIMVLDIRGEDDFAEGHIEGAVNIPFKEVGDNFAELPDNKPIYVVCYSGQTAGIAIAALRTGGYNAMSLARGMASWNDAELAVVKD